MSTLEPMEAPSRTEVMGKLEQLIQGVASRAAVSTWAEKWIAADDPPDMERDLWDALVLLTAADVISTDRPFLFGNSDFEGELKKLSNS